MPKRPFRHVPSDDGYDPEPDFVPDEPAEPAPKKARRAKVPVEPAADAVLPSHERSLSISFWGQAWNRHLMDYADSGGRMARGRTLLRQGRVTALAIEPGVAKAQVLDRDGETYAVRSTIKCFDDEQTAALREKCLGRVEGLSELLGGELGDDVMRAVTDPDGGLFPRPGLVRFSCTCLDTADVCAHSAATLYAVGAMLDRRPGLLFTLRGLDPRVLTETSLGEAVDRLTAPSAPADEARRKALEGMDLGEMFGL